MSIDKNDKDYGRDIPENYCPCGNSCSHDVENSLGERLKALEEDPQGINVSFVGRYFSRRMEGYGDSDIICEGCWVAALRAENLAMLALCPH